MRSEKKQHRHETITAAAYTLLATKGYNGTSMLSIAKAAKASNETLYRWYGDKRGLFEAMARDNAAETKIILEQAIKGRGDAVEILTRLSPVFLTMLLGERAISLNRAAAADPTGELGAALSAGGRNIIQPLLSQVIQDIGPKTSIDVQGFTDYYLSLLIGDLQIKRATRVQPELTKAQIEIRSRTALRAFFKLVKQE